MRNIIDGKHIATKFRLEIAQEVAQIKDKYGVVPTIAVVLVGEDPASQVYVANKEKAANFVGMKSIQYRFSKEVSEKELLDKIQELNSNKEINAILVQLPLPKHIDAKNILQSIDCKKDVDGFNIVNVGKLATGDVIGDDGAIIPCTPLGCLNLLKTVIGDDLSGLKVAIVGMSNIVGRPMAQLLLLEKCTVSISNSSTKNLRSETISADVIISAAGVPNLIKADMVQDGAIVIDVGINRITIGDGKTKFVGDVDFENVASKVKAITPVPGGVGPMTIAYLLQNCIKCFLKQI